MIKPNILVTGATGYVGGRLVSRLIKTGCYIRCLIRDPGNYNLPENSKVDAVQGDVHNPHSLRGKLDGIDVAYYLIHSLDSGPGYHVLDRLGAENFGTEARQAGVKKIIYLGGLGEPSDNLSSHLRSRQETGETLRQAGIVVIEFRASIIIGRGSLSYEMMRKLVERLPIMVTPKWVSTRCQPIFIDDVVSYLVEAIETRIDTNRIYEIGGPDVVSYGDLMREYAKQLGLRRAMVPVPVLTPYLSGLWLRLVTPDQAKIGRSLIEGLSNETIVKNNQAEIDFKFQKKPVSEAIRLSIEQAG